MNSQEALAFINNLFKEKKKQVLNDLETELFLGMWESKKYSEIITKIIYTEQYLREAGTKLCKKITKDLEITVKKNNFKNPILDKHKEISSQDSSSKQPFIETTNPVIEDISQPDDILQHNPFIPLNGRVENLELLFGREGEIRRIFELLNSGSSVALIGDEGIGKTSLLWAICERAKSDGKLRIQPVFLDLNLVHNEKEFYIALCDEIGIPESQGYMLTRNLRDKKVLLAIDNVGKLTWSGFTRQIRDQLRGLAESKKVNMQLILAAVAPLNQLFNDSQEGSRTSPLAGICQQVKLEPWNEQTAREFITSRLSQTSVDFTKNEIIQLIQESGGHPQKLMQMCYETYSKYSNSRDGG